MKSLPASVMASDGKSFAISHPVIETQVRVTSVRSRGSFGGVIFAGKNDAGESFVVKADFKLVPDPSLVEVAQVWTVKGASQVVTYTHHGQQRQEVEITPECLVLQRPSGKNIVGWIAQSPDCKGIGEVRARRLYERFGLELVSIIEAEDCDRLVEVIDREAAEALVAAFAKHGVAESLLWLEQFGLPKPLAASVIRYWGKDARSRIEVNPYVLVSFCARWKTVDEVARSRFGVLADDPRRLIAAAEDVLYRAMEAGDTALPAESAREKLRQILGSVSLAEQAIRVACNDSKLHAGDELVQAAGLAYIETYVARCLADMLSGTSGDQSEMFVAQTPDAGFIARALTAYEAANGIELTPEQRDAVLTSAANAVSLILGGAGTGKTTVLKALCHVLECASPGERIHQFALAGRAAQRMTQSTGRPAATIAAFLNGMDVEPGSTVLIDEMSMVDVILMYRVLKQLPAGVRLVLIGDPAQLPPIGPGLVLHALQGQASLPQTTLKTVKRQSSASGIPQVAQAVRDHASPAWSDYVGRDQPSKRKLGVGGAVQPRGEWGEAPAPSRSSGVSAIPCQEDQIDSLVAGIYEDLGADGSDFSVQVLCTTKNGPGGVKNINALMHELFAGKQRPVMSLHPDYGPIHERTEHGLGLFEGDLVMFGANDYTLGLRNGALGKVLHLADPLSASSDVCHVDFEGAIYALNAAHLRHVSHAYAITVHKSQGSQFDRVIVPVRSGKLLDNALLYTAITRGVSQVVLVGDIAAAERAIRAVSNSSRRCTRLASALAGSQSSRNLHSGHGDRCSPTGRAPQ